jgi:hypothetical protein
MKIHFHIRRLLTPSRLSAVLAIALALVICAGIVLLYNPHALGIHDATQPKTLLPGEVRSPSKTSSLATNWPIIVFWWVVGLPIYFLAYYLVHTAQRASHAKQTFKQLKRLPAPTMEQLVEHLLLRLVAIGVFVALCIVFVRNVVPYSALAMRTATDSTDTMHRLSCGLLSLIVIIVGVHVLTVFLRLSLGKVRIFS